MTFQHCRQWPAPARQRPANRPEIALGRHGLGRAYFELARFAARMEAQGLVGETLVFSLIVIQFR